MAVSTSVATIREAWFQLHGVMCIYKPSKISWNKLRNTLAFNICRDINQLEEAPPRNYVKIEAIRPNDQLDGELVAPTSYSVMVTKNLTDDKLVRGPAIQLDDLRLSPANKVGFHTSGVLVIGLNKGNRNINDLNLSRPITVYHVKGEFGIATDTHWDDGKVWEKTTYVHLSKGKLDRVLSSIQASNQKNLFQYCGVDPNSQTAYELASTGLLRPAIKGPTVVYGIKCVHFDPPNFTLEIHCINESESYLSALIHDLGLTLKTTAVCKQIRCIRYGCFTVEDALLRKHWSLKYFPDHMSRCHTKLKSLPIIKPQLRVYEQQSLNQVEKT